mmetsp:Transcript_21336/g.28067  ORF Transcript_21336/g.28067 Transcript_21336/m.28067 type:complete len:297 (+) Transcript_21336:733-1623(+)
MSQRKKKETRRRMKKIAMTKALMVDSLLLKRSTGTLKLLWKKKKFIYTAHLNRNFPNVFESKVLQLAKTNALLLMTMGMKNVPQLMSYENVPILLMAVVILTKMLRKQQQLRKITHKMIWLVPMRNIYVKYEKDWKQQKKLIKQKRKNVFVPNIRRNGFKIKERWKTMVMMEERRFWLRLVETPMVVTTKAAILVMMTPPVRVLILVMMIMTRRIGVIMTVRIVVVTMIAAMIAIWMKTMSRHKKKWLCLCFENGEVREELLMICCQMIILFPFSCLLERGSDITMTSLAVHPHAV